MKTPIQVTQTFLPPINEYMAQVQRAYKNHWLTNRGELVLELEEKLTQYLALKESKLLCMTNGTLPLQIAVKLLGKGGEIITTPFSYVATTSSIVWEGCTPVFVDIHPEYLTIDETKIEAAITEKTTCILATHVFGNPCHVEAIDAIAKKHNLKVIYDAAHCFGVTYKGKSIFEYGDVSTCSFHATKLFHTGEGGAVFCKDPDLYHKIFYSHNFGHKNQLEFYGLGINGKISELQAAMGLAVWPYISEIITKRKQISEAYNNYLTSKYIRPLKLRDYTQWNFSYHPVLFKSESALVTTLDKLITAGIVPRRYFYPSLNKLDYLNSTNAYMVSEQIANRILCLPIFHAITDKDIISISEIVNKYAI